MAVAACAACGRMCCETCRTVADDGTSRCQRCRVETAEQIDVDEALVVVMPQAVVNPPLNEVPWEMGGQNSDFRALIQTIQLGLFEPMRFANAAVRPRGDFQAPLIFAVLCGVFGYIGNLGRHLATGQIVEVSESVPGWSLPRLPIYIYDLLIAPAFPLLLTVALFAMAAMTHGLLRVIGQAPAPYESTFRAVAYAHAAKVTVLVPVVGPAIGTFFLVFLMLTTLRAAQNTPLGANLLGILPIIMMQLMLPGL